MENGSIILTALQQADGIKKNRPALVLCSTKPFQDLLVCGISTQLRTEVPKQDELMDSRSPDFAASGLLQTSVIRTHFLATISRGDVKGKIGVISRGRYCRIVATLANHFRALSEHE